MKARDIPAYKYDLQFPIKKKQYYEIVPELEKLGYSRENTYHDCDVYMRTHPRNRTFNHGFGTYIEKMDFNSDVVNLSYYNKDLILALASVREDDEIRAGDFVYLTHDSGCGYGIGDIARVIREDGLGFIVNVPGRTVISVHFPNLWHPKDWMRKATLEEILKYFNYKDSMEEKFTIEWLRQHQDTGVYCTTLKQLNKIASALAEDKITIEQKDELPAVIWADYTYPHFSWNPVSCKAQPNNRIGFDQVVFTEAPTNTMAITYEQKKYTAYAVYAKTIEEGRELLDTQERYFGKKGHEAHEKCWYRFCFNRPSDSYAHTEQKCLYVSARYLGIEYFFENIQEWRDYIVQTEGKQEELPAEYLVEVEPESEEADKIKTYINKTYGRSLGNIADYYRIPSPANIGKVFYKAGRGKSEKVALPIPCPWPIIPFKEWEQKINKNTQNNMEKEIIGYVLVKKEYEKFAFQIAHKVNVGQPFQTIDKNGCHILVNTVPEANLKSAGVLDIWFKPVYKDEIKEGDKVIIVKDYIDSDKNKQSYREGLLATLVRINLRHTYPYFVDVLCKDGSLQTNIVVAEVRKATPEEIERLSILEKEVVVGTPKKTLIIRSDKTIRDKDSNYMFKKNDIDLIYNNLDHNITLPCSLKAYVTSMHIGCSGKGTTLTKNDIVKIHDAYYSLNKTDKINK